MINYANEKVTFNGCPGCAYANHEFSLPSGMIFENEYFTLSQDWELPIPGFLVLSPKKHYETLNEIPETIKIEMFKLVDKTIAFLKDEHICEKYNVIFEEKENRHFHIWIMPRHDWMKNLVEDITDNIGTIFNYAKENLKTEENLEKIKEISKQVKKKFENEN